MENKKTLNHTLTCAKLTEKAIETIRSLEANGYNPLEVSNMIEKIIHTRVDRSVSAYVYESGES